MMPFTQDFGRWWLVLLLTNSQHSADAFQTQVTRGTRSVSAASIAPITMSEGTEPQCSQEKRDAALKELETVVPLKAFAQNDPGSAALYREEANSSCQFGGSWNGASGFHMVLDRIAKDTNFHPTCCSSESECTPGNLPPTKENIHGDISTFGPVNETSDDEGFYKYYVHVPKNCKNQVCPLLVYLHDANTLGWVAGMRSSTKCLSDMGVVTLQPLLPDRVGPNVPVQRRPWGWRFDFVSENFVRALVQQTVSQYAIDKSRVYIAGQSMGAVGAMYIALANPDLFTAAFPFSPTDFASPLDIDTLRKELEPLYKKRSSRLRQIYTTVGTKDDYVSNGEGHANHGRGLDWNIMKDFLKQMGVLGKSFVEMRLVSNADHMIENAAINEMYSILWQGEASL